MMAVCTYRRASKVRTTSAVRSYSEKQRDSNLGQFFWEKNRDWRRRFLAIYPAAKAIYCRSCSLGVAWPPSRVVFGTFLQQYKIETKDEFSAMINHRMETFSM